MSIYLMQMCWRVEFPSPAMSHVAVKLSDCANDDGENVYPSVGRVGRETRLGASTVRRVLSAFEQAGLVDVVAEVSGNKWSRSTTIRRINIARLHDLSSVEVRRNGRLLLAPSTHVLDMVEMTIEPDVREVTIGTAYGLQKVAIEPAASERKKERTKPRQIEVWFIRLRTPDDPTDYADDEPAPIPQRDTQDGGAYPAAGGGVSQSGIGGYPAAGYYPPIEPSDEQPPSPPMGGESAGSIDDRSQGQASGPASGADTATGTSSGTVAGSARRSQAGRSSADGWARGWTPAARDAVATVRSSPVVAHIAAELIDEVRGTLRPQKGADPAAYVRQLAARLRPFPAEALARAASVLLDTRGSSMPAASDVERIAAACAAELAQAAKTRQATTISRTRPVADPALAARWPEVRVALERALGPDTVAAWFATAALDRCEGGCLTVTVERPFFAKWIATHHAPALLAAAQATLGAVSRVEVTAADTTSGRAA